MDAQLVQQVLRFDQHVDQVRDRRTLVAADIGDTRLQDRLGDREDALAAEDLALAQPQRAHFLDEGAFRVGPLGNGKLGRRLVEHGAKYRGGYRRTRRSRLESRTPSRRAFASRARNGSSSFSRTATSPSRICKRERHGLQGRDGIGPRLAPQVAVERRPVGHHDEAAQLGQPGIAPPQRLGLRPVAVERDQPFQAGACRRLIGQRQALAVDRDQRPCWPLVCVEPR